MHIPDSFELSVPPDQAFALIKQRIDLGQRLLDYAAPRSPAARTGRLAESRREVDRWRVEKTALIESLPYEPLRAAPRAPEA